MHVSIEELAKSNNLFTLWRTWLAFLVFFSHGLIIFGESGVKIFDQNIGYNLPFSDKDIGGFAVTCFFSLSGFLITRSALKTEPIRWFRNRVYRILPAYVFVLFFTAFVIIPLILLFDTGNLDNYFESNRQGPISYFFWNITFPMGMQYGIYDVFKENPFGIMINGSSINGSLWTIPIEIRCYLISSFLVFFLSNRLRKVAASLLLLILFITKQLGSFGIVSYFTAPISIFQSNNFVDLLIPFLIGINLSLHSKTLSFKNPRQIGLLLTIFYFVSKILTRDLLPGELLFSLIPILLLTKISKSSRLYTLTKLPDLSYGIYLWAFFMSQCTQFYFHSFSIYFRFLIAGCFTLGMSWISYKLIERRIAIYSKR